VIFTPKRLFSRFGFSCFSKPGAKKPASPLKEELLMKVLIAAGGTAGHINPALAIAGEITARCPQAQVHFAGRKKGMEYGLVTRAGYPFHPIEVNGIQRRLTPKNMVRNAVALYHLALSAPRAAAILNEVKPDLVIGAGGYVSGPVVQAAQRRGIPTAIHEQNAFPGVTNKILAKHASVVLAAMPDAVSRLGAPEKTVVVGNPVRAEMFRADRAAARRALGVQPGQVVIVSFGGSLGAQVLNERVADLAVWELANRNFRHIHATGSIEKADFAALSEKLGIAHDARFEMLNSFQSASCQAGIAFGNAGCGMVHAMSYAVGATFHIAHGEVNYALFAAVMGYYDEYCDALTVPCSLRSWVPLSF